MLLANQLNNPQNFILLYRSIFKDGGKFFIPEYKRSRVQIKNGFFEY